MSWSVFSLSSSLRTLLLRIDEITLRFVNFRWCHRLIVQSRSVYPRLALFAGTYKYMYLTVLEMLITDSQIFELDVTEQKKSMTQYKSVAEKHINNIIIIIHVRWKNSFAIRTFHVHLISIAFNRFSSSQTAASMINQNSIWKCNWKGYKIITLVLSIDNHTEKKSFREMFYLF